MNTIFEPLSDIDIPGNPLIPFWTGVNISNFTDFELKIHIKKYWQLKRCLNTLGDGTQSILYSNQYLRKIRLVENIDTTPLQNHGGILFCSAAKKPTNKFLERVGYTFHVSSLAKASEWEDIVTFFMKSISITQNMLDNLLSAAQKLNVNHAFPISNFGFSRISPDLPYAQFYITNNYDTRNGLIHSVDIKTVTKNIILLFNGLKISFNIGELEKILQLLYDFGFSCAFYGLDICGSKLLKVKLYFRCSRYLDFDSICQYLKNCFKAAHFPAWKDIKSYIIKENEGDIHNTSDSYIDLLAIAFQLGSLNQLKSMGIQFYF